MSLDVRAALDVRCPPLPSCRSPVPKQVANFPVGIWSGSFLILSAIDHLLVVLPRVGWAGWVVGGLARWRAALALRVAL